MNSAVVKQNSQPHPRIIIRNRVKSLLLASVDVGGRIFCSRPKPLFLTELPSILIYFTEETANHESSAPRIYKRELSLIVEAVHDMESERDNALDDFLDSRAFEIENALLQDRFIGLPDLVEDCVLSRTENVNLTIEGDRDIASTRLMFTVTYRTAAYYIGQLDEFLRFTETITEPTGDIVLSDDITIRTE